ncbi:MAG: DUF4907 domain-containing protein [Bacteroidota bacterium]
MRNNIKHFIAFLTIAIVVVCIGILLEKNTLENQPLSSKGYRLEVVKIEVNEGWSYEIYYKGKLQIRQEFVPAVQGRRRFSSEKEARKMGELVLERLTRGESPIVSIQDLKNNGIAE